MKFMYKTVNVVSGKKNVINQHSYRREDERKEKLIDKTTFGEGQLWFQHALNLSKLERKAFIICNQKTIEKKKKKKTFTHLLSTNDENIPSTQINRNFIKYSFSFLCT